MYAHAFIFSMGPTHHSNSSGADAGAPWLHTRVREIIQGKQEWGAGVGGGGPSLEEEEEERPRC